LNKGGGKMGPHPGEKKNPRPFGSGSQLLKKEKATTAPAIREIDSATKGGKGPSFKKENGEPCWARRKRGGNNTVSAGGGG